MDNMLPASTSAIVYHCVVEIIYMIAIKKNTLVI